MSMLKKFLDELEKPFHPLYEEQIICQCKLGRLRKTQNGTIQFENGCSNACIAAELWKKRINANNRLEVLKN